MQKAGKVVAILNSNYLMMREIHLKLKTINKRNDFSTNRN